MVRAVFLYRSLPTRGFPEWGLHLYSNRKSPIGILLQGTRGDHARRCITAIRLSAKPIIVFGGLCILYVFLFVCILLQASSYRHPPIGILLQAFSFSNDPVGILLERFSCRHSPTGILLYAFWYRHCPVGSLRQAISYPQGFSYLESWGATPRGEKRCHFRANRDI